MIRVKQVCLMGLFLLVGYHASGQISGRLLKGSGEPFPGIRVSYKNRSVVTNNKGAFEIDGQIGDTLSIAENNYVVDWIPFTLYLQENGNKIIGLREVLVTGGRWRSPATIHFDKEDVAVYRGSANGELFNGIPGVQVNNIRNEAGALDIGIRGLQGQGRVPIIIDGGLQSTQTFRGYQGSSDRTYIEMDLVKSVEINKGASFNPGTIGATGGVVEMTTIGAGDVVLPDNKFGVLFKGAVSNNNDRPVIPADEAGQQYYVVQNDQKESKFSGGNATLGLAYKGDRIDFLVAGTTHNQGNYFAGKRGVGRYGYKPEYYDKREKDHVDNYKIPEVRPGQEVVNTSYVSKSALAKVGWNISERQRLEGNYRFHGQEAGEVLASYWYKNSNDANFESFPEGVESMPQWSPGTADIHSYSLNYRLNPNSGIDLHVSAFANDGKFKQRNGLAQQKDFRYGDQYLHQFENRRKGITAYNKTSFTSIGLKIDYGVTAQYEKMIPLEVPEELLGSARHGRRLAYSSFVSGNLELGKFVVQTEIKTNGAKVHDYTDGKDLKYGLNTDFISMVTYQTTKWLSIYGKASRIYRNPSLYESTKSLQTFSYNDSFPLKPEVTVSYEFGFNAHLQNVLFDSDKLTFGAGGFYNNSKNFISAALLPDFSFSFINYDRYRLKGFDLSLGYEAKHLFLNIEGVLYGKAAICSETLGTLYKTESCNSQGFDWGVLPNRIPPASSWTLSSGFYALDKKLRIGGRLRYHSEKKNPKDWLQGTGAAGVAVNLPADHVLDLFGTYRINRHFALTMSVDNLTDRYQYDIGSVLRMPVPGRTVHLGLEARF